MLFATNQSTKNAAAPPPLNGKHSIECRVFPRHSCSLDVACQPVAARDQEDPIWGGQIKDLSLGGVGLLLKRRFERGTSLAIEVPLGADLTETYLTRVIHVRATADGHWLHGCEFISKLSDDELQRLIENRPVPTPAPVAAPIVMPESPKNEVRVAKRHRVSGSARWRCAAVGEKRIRNEE